MTLIDPNLVDPQDMFGGNPKAKECNQCGSIFVPVRRESQCSPKCLSIYRRKLNEGYISGNWERYFRQLCQFKKEARQNIDEHMLIEILKKQDYLCAISGMELTCIRAKGINFRTNASIDRIDPNLGYNIDNIQIVCTIVNKMKLDMTMDEFVEWTKRVLVNAIYK